MSRRRVRELAVQCLYLHDQRGPEVGDEVIEYLRAETEDHEVRRTALDLIEGAIEQRDALDEEIRAVAENWDIGRMAVIDRNILRLATYEILHRDDIPVKVSINEAVDLGKMFSTENSGAFINGILDQIVRRHGLAT